MQIKFKLTRWDLFYSYLIMNFQQPFYLLIMVLPLVFLFYSIWSTTSSEFGLFIRLLTTIIMCVPPILVLIGIILILSLYVAFSKNNETILTEQEWIFTDDLLIYISEYSRSEIKWKALKRVVPLGNYCFVYLSQMGACIIPKRAFSSDQEWKEFISLCRSKLQK